MLTFTYSSAFDMSNMFANVSNFGAKGHAQKGSYLDYTLDDANQLVKKGKPEPKQEVKKADDSESEILNSDELLEDEIDEENVEQKYSVVVNDDEEPNVGANL